MSTNLLGSLYITELAVKQMLKQKIWKRAILDIRRRDIPAQEVAPSIKEGIAAGIRLPSLREFKNDPITRTLLHKEHASSTR